jgi:hypothetical protein
MSSNRNMVSTERCYMNTLLLITPRSRALLEKLVVSQLVKNVLASCRTQKFIPVFTTADYWTLS